LRATRRLLTALCLLLTLACAWTQVRAADGVEVVQAHLETTEEGYKLSSTFSFELNRTLEDAVGRGIPLYFTTDIEVSRPRWYWFDEKPINTAISIRVSYNVLTRQYRAAVSGGLQQNFSTLDDALNLVRRPPRWLVADRKVLKPGETYQVAVRMQLDVAQLPKPFQVNALNNSDWRLSSDWKQFVFKADSK
jgi:hypothetical protein